MLQQNRSFSTGTMHRYDRRDRVKVTNPAAREWFGRKVVILNQNHNIKDCVTYIAADTFTGERVMMFDSWLQ